MIEIHPENQTSDDDVEFEFHLFCAFPHYSKEIVDSQFVVTVLSGIPSPPCVSAAPPEIGLWSVGRLQPGEYQIIVNNIVGEAETQSFTVSQGVLPFPATSLPLLGVPAMMLLVVGLGWLANKAIKRTPNGAA